jgi:uncharacterized protein
VTTGLTTVLKSTLAFASIAMLLWAGAASADGRLAAAIQNNDRTTALALIRDGADVNAAQGDGTTPLHWAVYRLDGDLVDMLLERGADPNAVNRYGATPLGEAVKAADVRMIDRLLSAGADVEARNQDDQTALMLAARTGELEVARMLLQHGADPDAREAWRGQTALMWAADSRHADVVRLLIEAGADVNAQAHAYQWATQVTEEPRAQYRPTGGFTVLMHAARSACTDCVSALLAAGADVNRPNPDGITPLMIAIDNQAYDAARLIMEHGANPHVSDWYGRTALYVAADMSAFAGRSPNPGIGQERTTAHDIIRMLLAAGVNPNTQLNMHRPSRGGNIGRFVDDLLTTGATPLLRSSISHDVVAMRLLLEHGALVDLPNVMGVTPLMGAAGQGVSTRDRSVALGGSNVEERVIAALEVLLEAGADINARVTDIHSRNARIARPSTMSEREGQTALYGAIKFAWSSVVEYLIEQGAEVDIVDALGQSPIDAALGRVGGRDNVASQEIAERLRGASRQSASDR